MIILENIDYFVHTASLYGLKRKLFRKFVLGILTKQWDLFYLL